MTSPITAVFKTTIGLLEKASERTKEGDVTSQSFRRFIVREIEEVKCILDGLARKDLLASISFFKEGIEMLYDDVLERERLQTVQGPVESAAKGKRKLELSDLDEVLKVAKERFKDARIEATKAFANESLVLADRLLATNYRVMATILEVVDDPEYAIGTCKVCIEELHGLSAVKRSFLDELRKSIWSRHGKHERLKTIANVCLVNRVVYDVMKLISYREDFMLLPCVDTGVEKLDPLRDGRVAQLLREQGMEHCCIRWSFGQEGFDRLNTPRGIASTSDGHVLIADHNALYVFDSNGNFRKRMRPQNETNSFIIDVASSEVDGNMFVLVGIENSVPKECAVLVLNKNADLRQHKFPVGRATWYDFLHSTVTLLEELLGDKKISFCLSGKSNT